MPRIRHRNGNSRWECYSFHLAHGVGEVAERSDAGEGGAEGTEPSPGSLRLPTSPAERER
jgi:hypothetical protein